MPVIPAYQKSAVVILVIFITVLLLTQCINRGKAGSAVKNLAGEQFAGSAACANCHKAIYNSQVHTAHARTASTATAKNIKGSFDQGKNSFVFSYNSVVVMEKRQEEFFQVEYASGAEATAKRFDLVIGSGTKGQSYLFSDHQRLFQLPISYYTSANQWSNSPGYPEQVKFDRPINARCLECHSTYAKTLSVGENEQDKFDNTQMILGITCEKCHGPGAAHVAYQSQYPAATSAKFIVNTANLTRQQNIELCASCHGGKIKGIQPAFSFGVGKDLSKYFELDTTMPDPDKVDVHGNQLGLLSASKCFKNSESMTCSTCHNTHENERGNNVLFNQRCMSCHNQAHENYCKLKNPPSNEVLQQHCTDCHMPVKSSRAIAVMLRSNAVPTAAKIRSHFINIYPEETKRVLDFIEGTAFKIKH